MVRYFIALYWVLLVICSCNSDTTAFRNNRYMETVATVEEQIATVTPAPIDTSLDKYGLVDVESVVPGIMVDLRYSSRNNFTGRDVYGDLNKCFLERTTAEKLKNAQALLTASFPYYTLKIYDGMRPMHVQRYMWDSAGVPLSDRRKYLSDPDEHSLHNFGCAVDITICDQTGAELDMGTPYDYFGETAHTTFEEELYDTGRMSASQILNRQILREVMMKAGFTPIKTEWWHFNSCSRAFAEANFPLIP